MSNNLQEWRARAAEVEKGNKAATPGLNIERKTLQDRSHSASVDQGDGTPIKPIHKVVGNDVKEQTMDSLVSRMEKWNANKQASKFYPFV